MTFRRRTYPEVLDHLLTAVTDGVAAERHPFPPPNGGRRHGLERPPAAAVVSLHGSRDGASHRFRQGTDYALVDAGRQIEWAAGGDTPDGGSVFEVSYYPAAAAPLLTDVETGSVVRTLAETFALEVARVYAELEAVYRSAYVDTAAGSALDNVVALLGIERVAAGRASGELEFTRAAGSRGIVTIPAGTRVITADGGVEYETTETVSMADGQTTVRANARDREANEPLAAGALTVLPVPRAGVGAVTNPAPTALASRDETDAELRARAKGFLHGSERATRGALLEAVARQGLRADLAEAAPGRVVITPHADALTPEQRQRLLTAVDEVRPAGVVVEVAGAEPPRRLDLALRLTTRPGLLESDLRAVQRAVRERLAEHFDRLPAREPVSVNRLVGQVLTIPEIEDVAVVAAAVRDAAGTATALDPAAGAFDLGGAAKALGELHLADPALPTVADLVVAFPAGVDPPDQPALAAALAAAVAHVNAANEEPAAAGLVLTFAELAAALPLPGRPQPTPPVLDPAAARLALDTGPYRVEAVLSQHGGLSRRLRAAGDAYPLTPFERLAAGGVAVTEDDGGD